jgi:hypothetical protein
MQADRQAGRQRDQTDMIDRTGLGNARQQQPYDQDVEFGTYIHPSSIQSASSAGCICMSEGCPLAHTGHISGATYCFSLRIFTIISRFLVVVRGSYSPRGKGKPYSVHIMGK